jgi:hypothetical protein
VLHPVRIHAEARRTAFIGPSVTLEFICGFDERTP